MAEKYPDKQPLGSSKDLLKLIFTKFCHKAFALHQSLAVVSWDVASGLNDVKLSQRQLIDDILQHQHDVIVIIIRRFFSEIDIVSSTVASLVMGSVSTWRCSQRIWHWS